MKDCNIHVFVIIQCETDMICNVYRTRWGNNSSTRGSYSFIKVGASMTDIDLLAEPLTDSETEKVSPGGEQREGLRV